MLLESLLAPLLLLAGSLGPRVSAADNATALSQCPCEARGHIATCSFMDLAAIPACLTGDSLTQLYLDHNSLRQLTADQLRPFPLLRMLSVEGNQLSSLPQDLLRYTPRLRELYFSENRIDNVSPLTFLPVPNLQKLVLSENSLSALPSDAFSGLPKLLELDLSGNQLTSFLSSAIPASIRTLRLHGNQLQSLPAEWPTQLEELDLSSNMLRGADPAPFHRLSSLRELRLEGNPWNCSCESTGALADFVLRKNFAEDMEDPMLCASPSEVKESEVLHILRHCNFSATAAPTTSIFVTVPGIQTSLVNVSPTKTGTVPVNKMCPQTTTSKANENTNTTDSATGTENTHARETLTITLIILVTCGFFVVLIVLLHRIYNTCWAEYLRKKQDQRRLVLHEEESAM